MATEERDQKTNDQQDGYKEAFEHMMSVSRLDQNSLLIGTAGVTSP